MLQFHEGDQSKLKLAIHNAGDTAYKELPDSRFLLQNSSVDVDFEYSEYFGSGPVYFGFMKKLLDPLTGIWSLTYGSVKFCASETLDSLRIKEVIIYDLFSEPVVNGIGDKSDNSCFYWPSGQNDGIKETRSQVWPNPSNGTLQINNQVDLDKLEILDPLGRNVPFSIISPSRIQINVQHSSQQIFYLIESSSQTAPIKLIMCKE